MVLIYRRGPVKAGLRGKAVVIMVFSE